MRFVSSFQVNRFLMWGAAVSMSLDVVASYILIRLVGVAGIGLSTTLVYLVPAAYPYRVVQRLFRQQ